MTYFIGTDEAGYGPNLGPLVVSASCWRRNPDADFDGDRRSSELERDATLLDSEPFPIFSKNQSIILLNSKNESKKTTSNQFVQPTFFDDENDDDLSSVELIKPFDSDKLIDRFNADCRPVSDRKKIFPIVDSKKLFQSSGSIAPLERSFFLAFFWANRRRPSPISYAELLERIEGDSEVPFWERNKKIVLPLDSQANSAESLQETTNQIVRYFEEKNISLVGLKCRRIFPQEFNRRTERSLKSDLLAETTLTLIAYFMNDILNDAKKGGGSEKIVVICDKLGGRNKYGSTLLRFFPSARLKPIVESKPISVYQGTLRDEKFESPIEIRFQMKGESNVPTALASIIGKYLRELSMKLFNEFWQNLIPNLKPTAGYPVDARRFYQEIAAINQKTVQIDESSIWRNK